MNPNRDTTAITGLIIGCILFGLGSLIIVFVPLGSFAMSFWRLLIGSLVFAALAWRYRPARPKTRRTWLFAILAGIFSTSTSRSGTKASAPSAPASPPS